MIIKNKETSFSKDIRQIAGEKQEQDVAFYLRRAFKDDQQVFVINDLRFEFNEEIAQIDHLIIYPYGFVLIESKSITGEVKVNNNQEWTRSYNKQWTGMPSPIKQVEQQEDMLLDLLLEAKAQLLPKVLFGLVQQGFAGRCWDHICAISSNAIVHRDDMPKKISKKLVKSEFVVDKLTELMNIPTSKLITALKAGDTRPMFSAESLDKISNYLMLQHKPSRAEQVHQIIPELSEPITQVGPNTQPLIAAKQQPPANPDIVQLPQLACKKCNNTVQLQAAWGKFGYYVKCPSCNANTAMKQGCPSCNSKNTKINKHKAYYYLTCQDCNTHNEIFVQSSVTNI